MRVWSEGPLPWELLEAVQKAGSKPLCSFSPRWKFMLVLAEDRHHQFVLVVEVFIPVLVLLLLYLWLSFLTFAFIAAMIALPLLLPLRLLLRLLLLRWFVTLCMGLDLGV